MRLVEIDRIEHGLLETPHDTLFDVRLEAGRRAEMAMPPGRAACLQVLEGSVRIEGDDTAALEGDVVWFKAPRTDGEPVLLGLEADTPFRGVVAAAR